MSTAEDPERLVLGYRLDIDVAVVTVTGEVDVTTCGLLRDALLRVVADEHRRGLVVNLASVTFIDSTGIGVLVGIWHRIRASHGSLALAAPSRQARRVLVTTGLTKAFSVYDTEAEAVQAFRQQPCG
jgi:anti-sigma B factor antagonist